MADVDTQIAPIISEPGIKRDGTQFDGNNYTDGQWVRWSENGLPKKILGYRQSSKDFTGPGRGMYVIAKSGLNYTTVGSPSTLEQIEIDINGYGGGITDRTPVGFASSTDNVWMLDSMFDAGGNGTALIAHAAPNLTDISSSVLTDIYYGNAFGTPVLTAVGKQTSGGIVVAAPYLFAYGNDGLLEWTDANSPTVWAPGTGDAGSARICGSKLIKALPVRGGSSSPAIILFSLDSVYKVSYVGGTALFRSDYIGGTSLLSTSAVVEFNGLYFWPTTAEQFVTYNGTLQVVKNAMNKDWMFKNLNWDQRQKVWGVPVYQSNEIWWFYPRGTATECTNYVVYNVALNTWYDGELARSCGVSGYVFRWPLMTGLMPNVAGKYQLWQHEFGYDQVTDQSLAIPSWFQTGDVSFCATGPSGQFIGKDVMLYVDRVENDFNQVGPMTLTVSGRKFAESDSVSSIEYPFSLDDNIPYLAIQEQYREVRYKFMSNVQGGYYELGQTLMRYKEGDQLP